MMLKPNLQIDIKFIFWPGATAFKQVRTPTDKTKDNWKPKRNSLIALTASSRFNFIGTDY